jgi:hypothetical protein
MRSRSTRAVAVAFALTAGAGTTILAGAVPAGANTRTIHSVSATYTCVATVLGSGHTFTSPITLSGTTPATVAPGASVTMTGFQSKVTIPASLIQSAEGYGVTWVSGSSFSWTINATDALVKGKNAGRGLSIPKTNLPTPAAAVTVTLPVTPKSVGPWTAGTAGKMTFTDGHLKFTLNDNVGVSVPVSCSPKPAVTLSTTTVS